MEFLQVAIIAAYFSRFDRLVPISCSDRAMQDGLLDGAGPPPAGMAACGGALLRVAHGAAAGACGLGSLWTDARGISRFDLPVSRLAGCATLLASARASAARQGAIIRAKSPPWPLFYALTFKHLDSPHSQRAFNSC